MPPLFSANNSSRNTTMNIGRPDNPLLIPRSVVIHTGPGRRSVERFMRVEFINEKKPSIMMGGSVAKETLSVHHRLRTGVILLSSEKRSRPVISSCGSIDTVAGPEPASTSCRHGRGANPCRIFECSPQIPFMSSHIVPPAKVNMVILSTCFKQVGVVGG